MSEHQVTSSALDPTMGVNGRQDWRIRCSCGWTEKFTYIVPSGIGNLTLKTQQRVKSEAMFHWERHVYTPYERLILSELEGKPKPDWWRDRNEVR